MEKPSLRDIYPHVDVEEWRRIDEELVSSPLRIALNGLVKNGFELVYAGESKDRIDEQEVQVCFPNTPGEKLTMCLLDSGRTQTFSLHFSTWDSDPGRWIVLGEEHFSSLIPDLPGMVKSEDSELFMLGEEPMGDGFVLAVDKRDGTFSTAEVVNIRG